MKARKDMRGELNLHAELYHRHKIDALRAEGYRLRRELQSRGADPAIILLEAQQDRRKAESN